MSTFVLVHGACFGGWCWKQVTPVLWEADHVAYAPTLTGLGHRSHLATRDVDLDTHIQDVVNVLEFEDLHDVILVGWSYGGMSITGTADKVPDRIARLVYLDADVPRDSEVSGTSAERMAERRRYAHEHGDGWRAFGLAPDIIARILRRSLPEDMVDWAVSRLVPQPLTTWTQPIRLSNPALFEIPSTFIRCTQGFDENDPDAVRVSERMRTEPGWGYREIDADHFAPLAAPNLVAEVLLELAQVPAGES